MIESVLFTISLFLVYVSVSLLLQPPPPLFLVFPLFSLALFEVLACVRLLLPSRMERVFCCFYCVSLSVPHECTYFFLFPGAQRGAACAQWHGRALAGVVLGDSILHSVQPQAVLSTAVTSRLV